MHVGQKRAHLAGVVNRDFEDAHFASGQKLEDRQLLPRCDGNNEAAPPGAHHAGHRQAAFTQALQQDFLETGVELRAVFQDSQDKMAAFGADVVNGVAGPCTNPTCIKQVTKLERTQKLAKRSVGQVGIDGHYVNLPQKKTET